MRAFSHKRTRSASAFASSISRPTDPLASIKASATTLLQHDVQWSEADRNTLLANIDDSADRLNGLITNLLDMSRISAARQLLRRKGLRSKTSFAVAVAGAQASSKSKANTDGEPQVAIEVDSTLPLLQADAGLLERSLANVISNAIAWSPKTASSESKHRKLVMRFICVSSIKDLAYRGPTRCDICSVPAPGDHSNEAGVGLGLAVSKGFVEAMADKSWSTTRLVAAQLSPSS